MKATRSDEIYLARVYLREARSRAKHAAQRGFCFVLLGWAANCRARAMAIQPAPAQFDLFSTSLN